MTKTYKLDVALAVIGFTIAVFTAGYSRGRISGARVVAVKVDAALDRIRVQRGNDAMPAARIGALARLAAYDTAQTMIEDGPEGRALLERTLLWLRSSTELTGVWMPAQLRFEFDKRDVFWARYDAIVVLNGPAIVHDKITRQTVVLDDEEGLRALTVGIADGLDLALNPTPGQSPLRALQDAEVRTRPQSAAKSIGQIEDAAGMAKFMSDAMFDGAR